MRNAAPRGDNMMWCMGDWLMPFLWEMLGNSQGMVLYMPMLCMSQVFFLTRVVCPAFLHQKK